MADHGVVCSMSRSGNVWDNAAMESFFSSLKTERTAGKLYRTRAGSLRSQSQNLARAGYRTSDGQSAGIRCYATVECYAFLLVAPASSDL
jgi:transposase InsO family protein